MSRRAALDSDAIAVRRASRVVGLRIAMVCSLVVVVVIAAVVLYILSRITPAELFEPLPNEDNLQISAIELLRAAAALGIALIALAGVLSWLVTRRAVEPLGTALRIQRAFIADASHELRTPLAVLDARLQVLERTLPEGDRSAGLVGDLRRDSSSLIRIVNDLLESAESEGPVLAPVPVDVLPAVESAVRSLSLIGDARGVTIEMEADAPVSTFLPAARLTRCVVALLDNALRFAPRDSAVTVTVTGSKRWVSVTVRDVGPGIHGIDPARIFDRFAHAAPAEGEGIRPGFGIGLSLVRESAVRYGGSVRIVDSGAHGTAIAVDLPRARP